MEPPAAETGADVYTVDFTVTTGPNNRWMTQMGQPVLGLDDRGAMDTEMLTYTTVPLAEDLQVTGTPVVSLQLSSTHADGAFLVYLEDVDPEGRSRYVTEGGLRAIHRKVSENPHFAQKTPYHSFAEADAQPLVPGETAELAFQLWPISVLFRKGHRIRLAIAGADDENFLRVPAEGAPTITVARNAAHVSLLDLPVVAPGAERPHSSGSGH
jgi:putative CocE/NonD family hydrolase